MVARLIIFLLTLTSIADAQLIEGVFLAEPQLFAQVVTARRAARVATYPCLYDFCEGFENPTGYERAGWVETLTVVDEDYTGSVGAGAQALLLDPGSSCTTSNAIGPYDEVFAHFQVRIEDLGGASIVSVRNGANVMGYVTYHQASGKLYIDHGGAASGFTTTILAEDTWYHVWIRWKKVVVANDGIFQLWISATPTKPGSPEIDFATGAGASQVNAWFFQSENPVRVIFDDLQIDDIAIP